MVRLGAWEAVGFRALVNMVGMGEGWGQWGGCQWILSCGYPFTALADEDQRNGRNAPTLAQHIHQITLVVRHAGRHFLLQRFHGENFDSHINSVGYVEVQVLYEQIVGDKCILSELDFHRNAIFDEISLIV